MSNNVAEIAGNDDVLKQLEAVGVTPQVCPAHGPTGDHWPRRFKMASPKQGSAIVCYPEDAKGVSEILKIARKTGQRVAAIGLGSSVVGCFDGDPDIYCSTRRMDRVEDFDSIDCQVTVGAGMNGGDLQRYLSKCGFELGQTPQSLYMSTVGGWVNTRAAGGLSTLYGGIEDVVTGIEAVLPNGDIINIAPRPRASGGLDPLALLIGTEGSLAIVTKVTLSVFRQLPTLHLAAGFDTFGQSIEAQRQMVQGGLPVGLVRSYNEAETDHILSQERPYSMLHFTLSAPGSALDGLQTAAKDIIAQCGGKMLNEDAARHWFSGRYQVETMMEDRNATDGSMFDTVEVSLPWSTAEACVNALEDEVGPLTTKLFAHFSHAYQTGACLYVIFWIDKGNDKEVVQLWSEIWNSVTEIVSAHGGTLSHHHGIGAVRSEKYLQREEGILHKAIKSALDPDSVLFARLIEQQDA